MLLIFNVFDFPKFSDVYLKNVYIPDEIVPTELPPLPIN